VIRHQVLTTEKVPFSYRVAGLGSRFLAWLVDLFVIVGLDFMGAMVGSVLIVGRPGLGSALFLVWNFVVLWGYFLFFEWLWHGQTPGKALLGIRVIQWRGTEMNFFQSAVRNLLRVVDSLPVPVPLGPGLLGFVVAACNRENRRLGDLAADTLVVHVELPRDAEALQHRSRPRSGRRARVRAWRCTTQLRPRTTAPRESLRPAARLDARGGGSIPNRETAATSSPLSLS